LPFGHQLGRSALKSDNEVVLMTNISKRDAIVGAGSFAIALLMPEKIKAKASISPAIWTKLNTETYKGKQDDISFISSNIGWYGNGAGKLFRTQDGGQTWNKIWEQPGTFIRALGFIDEKIGFLGNIGTDYFPNVTDKHPLYRTDDGGMTWKPVTALGIESVPGICSIDIHHQHTMFQGNMANTYIIHAAGRVGGPAMILKSVNSGQDWIVLDLTKQAGMILDIKFHDSRNGFVCAATSKDIDQSEALMLRTTDGGKTWSEVYRSGRKSENCWKMSWPSRHIGYATIQSYNEDPSNANKVIIKTTNGGKSWREIPLVTDVGVQQFGIGFLNEKRGWVGCRGTGYETADGGRNWIPVSFGKAVNKIRITGNGNQKRLFAIGVDVHRLDL
jgi:photosystem II stability/assembly factor-like uncharacterized protein